MEPLPAPQPHQTPLNPTDLDEDVAQAVRQRVDVLLGSDGPPPHLVEKPDGRSQWAAARKQLRKAVELPLWAKIARIIGNAFLILAVVCLFPALTTTFARDDSLVYWLCIPLLFVAGCVTLNVVQRKEQSIQNRQALMPETFALVLPLLARKNTLQTAYCDAVCALLKQQAAWGANATQNVFHDLKSLLHTGKQTALRRAEIEQAMSHQSLADLEAEAVRLAARTEQATGEAARETYKQTLILLEIRLMRAESLEPLRQQLEAQEEVITQALFEAQSALSGASLSHWAFAPSNALAAETDAPHVPLVHLGDTVTRLRQQTEAIEQAVREVMVVGGAASKKG